MSPISVSRRAVKFTGGGGSAHATPPRAVRTRGTESAHAPGPGQAARGAVNETAVTKSAKISTFSKFQTPQTETSSFSYVKVACCLCGGLLTCPHAAPRKLPATLPSRATRGLQALSKQASQSHAVYGALSAERFRARQGHPTLGGGRGTSSRTLVGHSGVQWGTVGVPLRPPRSGARPACAP